MKVLEGKPISPGYAKGSAFIYSRDRLPDVPRFQVEEDQLQSEQDRLSLAMQRSRRELRRIQRRVLAELGQTESEIFSAHLALLEDEQFIQKVRDRISHDRMNVEQAVQQEIDDFVQIMSEVQNEYLRERAHDVQDVGHRVLRHLGHSPGDLLQDLPPATVLVACELLPSDTLNIDRNHVAGIVVERGGDTSHAAILARSMGIPAISQVAGACSRIATGAQLLVDGEHGTVTVGPEAEQAMQFSELKWHYAESTSSTLSETPGCCTRDGEEIHLEGNIGRPIEALSVRQHNLEGVGLFRTEYIFLAAQSPPGARAQARAYQQVIEALPGLPVAVRTLDLGDDKWPPFLSPPADAVPIGQRGLCFSLREEKLLRTQLQAIFQAREDAGRQDIRLLLPMVLGSGDLQKALRLIRTVGEEMKVQTLPQIGAMIETPSALFELREIVRAVDFLSLGTNDLVQYLLAADREAMDMLSTDVVLRPAVLRAIRQVVETAREAGKALSVCGEIAGDPHFACLLVGLGVRRLSMSPVRAPRVRYAVCRSKVSELTELADRMLASNAMERNTQMLLECCHDVIAPSEGEGR